MTTPNFIGVLGDLIDLLGDESIMQFCENAQFDKHLAQLFRVLPANHPVWGLAESQQRERAFHRDDLRRRDEALAKIGLVFWREGREMRIQVRDYPRLVAAVQEFGANQP